MEHYIKRDGERDRQLHFVFSMDLIAGKTTMEVKKKKKMKAEPLSGLVRVLDTQMPSCVQVL